MLTKTSKCSVFTLALILLCSSANGVAGLDMNHICLLLTNNALIASGNSCSSYYSCLNGVATLQYCSSGTYFDKNSQACVSQAPSYCNSGNADPCLGHAVGTFVAANNSCAGFYYCSANGAKRSNCPDGLVFNEGAQQCDFRSNYPCDDTTIANNVNTDVVNLCSFIQNGIWFGNAFDCSVWEKCINDNSPPISGSCNSNGDGLVFDTANVSCNYPADVTCSQVTNDASLAINSAATGGTCSTNGAMTKATACNQYYLCNGNTNVLKSCIGTLYFDVKSSSCMSRLDAYNNCDRCVSTTDAFVNAFGTNCTGYSFCSHGVFHSSGTCPSGFFFNEEMQACTETNPSFPFCAATATTITPTGTTEAGSGTTEAPTEAPNEKPTEAPIEAPTEKPTEAPAEAPTEAPAEAPTEAPAEAPTEAPPAAS